MSDEKNQITHLQILAIILGSGLLSTALSLIVTDRQQKTYFQMESQRIQEQFERERIYDIIYKTYILDCIHPLICEINQYSQCIQSSIYDLKDAWRYSENITLKEKYILNQVDTLYNNSLFMKILTGNTVESLYYLPHLRHFGYEVHRSVLMTINHFTVTAIDITNKDFILSILYDENPDTYILVLDHYRIMAQFTARYVEQRLIELENYMWECNYNNFNDFIKIRYDSKLIPYIFEMTEFNQKFTEYGEIPVMYRAEKYFEFSMWINEKVKTNLLSS